MYQLKISFIVIVLLLMTACGYRLAGKAELDPIFENTYIAYQGNARLVAELIEKQFKANGYNIVTAEQATAIVDVLYETREKQILSLDEDGKVREYELLLSVGFQVEDDQGKALVSRQQVRLSRDFLFEINELLGKTSEEQQLYQEMRADASRLILYRLQAITSVDIEEFSREQAESEAASSEE